MVSSQRKTKVDAASTSGLRTISRKTNNTKTQKIVTTVITSQPRFTAFPPRRPTTRSVARQEEIAAPEVIATPEIIATPEEISTMEKIAAPEEKIACAYKPRIKRIAFVRLTSEEHALVVNAVATLKACSLSTGPDRAKATHCVLGTAAGSYALNILPNYCKMVSVNWIEESIKNGAWLPVTPQFAPEDFDIINRLSDVWQRCAIASRCKNMKMASLKDMTHTTFRKCFKERCQPLSCFNNPSKCVKLPQKK